MFQKLDLGFSKLSSLKSKVGIKQQYIFRKNVAKKKLPYENVYKVIGLYYPTTFNAQGGAKKLQVTKISDNGLGIRFRSRISKVWVAK